MPFFLSPLKDLDQVKLIANSYVFLLMEVDVKPKFIIQASFNLLFFISYKYSV